MERIERIDRRDGVEPVRLELLTPLERERDRQERERRRRVRRRPAGQTAAEGQPGPAGESPPRLDIRA